MAEIGQTLGDFTLESEIGRGGMGVVYLARQRSLGRHVALKVLPRELVLEPMYVGRFKREAEAVSRLDHPHIVPVIAVGEDQGHHFIAMKFVKGVTLDAWVRMRSRGAPAPVEGDERTEVLEVTPAPAPERPGPRLTVAKAIPARGPLAAVTSLDEAAWRQRCVAVIEKIAMALAHAHAHGIVHRDVKPGNILVDRDGEPWLLDFGLVRDLADDRTFCDGRTVLGTAQYMSPEQVKGLRRQTDQRSDVYSLGVTLYELLTLTRPFDDRDTTAILHAVVEEEPPSPRSVVRDLPVDLETVVLKAMAKRPEHRYASAGEMAADLKRLRLRQPILAHRPGFARWRRKLKGAQTTVAAGLLLAFASVTGLAGVTVWRNGRDDLARREALMAADTAFHAGEYEKAVEEYRVFLRLGGREEDVGARLQEARRLADGPEGR